MSELILLNESVVDESEIDSLGHMNVRFYMSRVSAANRELCLRAGIIDEAGGKVLRRTDTYSRFRNEQFAGATLHTLGGFVTTERSDTESVSAYFEIRNPDKQSVAASFVITSALVDVSSQEIIDFQTVEPADELFVQVPDEAKPRSLSLATPAVVTLEDIEPVIREDGMTGMGSGRRENSVHIDDCDENGRLREDVDLMFVMHRQRETDDESNYGPPQLKDAEGRRYSWAMMETRSVVFERPMVGDHVLSLGADVAYGEKWRQSRRWMFVKDTGVLLGISDSVGLCIDLDARRAMRIPDETRLIIEKNYLPQFL